MPVQQSFELRTWGGKRRGAGRPSTRDGDAQPHVARDAFTRPMPVHVTLRFLEHVWNLRSERSFAVIHRALEAARRRPDARVVHFTILGNHLHVICEADSSEALSNAVRALSIRLSRGLNRMMGRRGPVFADRYDAHVLRTPAEVRNALRYVLGNFASHARRRGEPMREGWVDPFSSAVVKVPREAQGVLFADAVTTGAETWLLREGASLMCPVCFVTYVPGSDLARDNFSRFKFATPRPPTGTSARPRDCGTGRDSRCNIGDRQSVRRHRRPSLRVPRRVRELSMAPDAG